MAYVTTREIAEKWGVSQILIRRLCRQDRIPGAMCREGVWLIPEDAVRVSRTDLAYATGPELPELAKKLQNQKKKKNFHGLYDYVVIDLTYSSSRMASCRLTRQQVETIFRKGKVRESFEPMKISDLIEVMNHCVCVDYILDHIAEPLTQKMIQYLHFLLMFGTVDQRKGRVTPGVYRTDSDISRNRSMLPPAKINSSLGALIKEYEAQTEIGGNQILDFHVRFEQIFPFGDGNGRIGRLIMFKECLRHGVMPFIIDDKRRSRYLHGIREWHEDRYTLTDVVMDAQSRFEAQIELQRLHAAGQFYAPVTCKEGFDDEDE